MKKRLLLAFALLLFALNMKAQDFGIVSVEELYLSGLAIDNKVTESGSNGRDCALLCIATQNLTPEQRESFNFESDHGSKIEQRADRDGEIWLWVTPGVKHLTLIGGRTLGRMVLHFVDYGISIESLRTYKITIRGKALSLPPDNGGNPAPTKQFLAFQITPANAVLEVDDKVWSLDASGSASRYLDFGVYSYRVRASDYFPEEGKVTVNDPDNTHIVKVDLRPDFAEVTLVVDADAEIWVNNQRKGTRSWSGSLGSGSYKVECRQANHETSVTSLDITAAMTGQTISLPAPKPIYGSLLVESTPNFCKIFIDGKEIGATPKSVNEILIGSHEVRLAKEGYADYSETVTVKKGEMSMVKVVLKEGIKDGEERNKDEETFTVNGVSFTMKLVEGGTFRMGSDDSDADNDEKPVHSVTLSSYYMGETEVTQALWRAVMGSNPSYFKGDNLPVARVSWNDCQEFIRKLNQKTGKNFRLPTEAEWEYAARGGNKSKGYKYSGSNTINTVAWYTETTNDSGIKTVKGKSPNELGLYDMSGNVLEWCQDWYGSYNSGSQTNPTGPSSGSRRVLRGGSWCHSARFCRVSYRGCNDPGIRINFIGFRLVLPQ